MLKIVTVDTLAQRRLVVRGKLVEPWVPQFQRVWEESLRERDPRDLVADLREVGVMNQHAENIVAEMVARGAEVIGGPVTRQAIDRIAARLLEQGRPLDLEDYTIPPVVLAASSCDAVCP